MLFRRYYVYILASHARVLYVGVTNDMTRRLEQHRSYTDPHAFVTQYKVTKLVYFEEYQTATQAIARETQLKAYRRSKKVALIQCHNPHWVDVADLAPPARPDSSLRSE